VPIPNIRRVAISTTGFNKNYEHLPTFKMNNSLIAWNELFCLMFIDGHSDTNKGVVEKSIIPGSSTFRVTPQA
jgi:hypothetical protein